ncbi:MAG: PD-(D/E)XK nuclease family protein, partial [Anaerolineae bacterium]|nr:PD-(D/E)XK nuclease family protein [Anaerolineae bacterium]
MTDRPWVVLNVSRLDDYARCPMFYYWRHEAKKVPPRRAALGFGTSIHEPIATWYQTFEIDKVLTKFWETFEAQEGLDPELGTYGERLVKGYCLHWADDPDQFEIEAVEQRLVADLENEHIGLRLVGRPDLIARTRIGRDRLWHIQHKTCAANTSYGRYVAAYNLNWHERAYAVLGRANGFDIQGTVLNLIRKTKQVHTQHGDDHTFKREYIPLGEDAIEKF